jgi:hypothetical protein
MKYKNRITETDSMRRLMGLQPINERIVGPDAAGQERMQKLSNIMTPEGWSQPGSRGAIQTLPFKDSTEGRDWNPSGPFLSSDRLAQATNKTIKNANVGSWKASNQNAKIISIEDAERLFLYVGAPRGCEPNWCYVVMPGPDFPIEFKTEDFKTADGTKLKNYEEYASFLENILHKHASIGTPTEPETEPEVDKSWCKRFLDIDWYFDKLKIGKGYLKKYDCGDAVMVAQDHMNEYEGSEVLKVDSAYGDDTIEEVKKVQGELDTKVDGYYGKNTHDVLIRAIGAGKGGPDQPKDSVEKMPVKGPEEIDIEIDSEIIVPDDPTATSDQTAQPEDIEYDDKEFEKKQREKALKRYKRKQKKREREERRRGKRRKKGEKKMKKVKARYDLDEQKTFKIKKDNKVITLTESDVRKIVKSLENQKS